MGKWSEIALQTYNALQIKKKNRERGVKAADNFIKQNTIKTRMRMDILKRRGIIQ